MDGVPISSRRCRHDHGPSIGDKSHHTRTSRQRLTSDRSAINEPRSSTAPKSRSNRECNGHRESSPTIAKPLSQDPHRPGSGSSGVSMATGILATRPASSHGQALSRAGSRLSARIQALPHGKRTISRISRRSRPVSSASALPPELETGAGGRAEVTSSAHSEADTDICSRPAPEVDPRPVEGVPFDLGWDTDLEIDASADPFDTTGRAVYLESCRQGGVIPASYFLRNMRNSTLDMKHHGLGPTGVRPLAVALVSNTFVLKLNLRDNWLGNQGGLHICDMLMENCYITDLDLSDNNLGIEFIINFSVVAGQNSTLTHVTLSGNGFGDGCASKIADMIANTGRLEVLDLSHNQFGEVAGLALGPAIAENASIRELDLSWNCFRRKGAEAISKGVKQNMTLEKLNISWNGFGVDGAAAMGDTLKFNATLTELDIQNNRITTEGAVLFGKGLSSNETLRVLMMGKNPMQSAGCYGICAAILKNPGSVIQQLDFTDILVNADFDRLLTQVKENLPEIKVRVGSELPKKPKVRAHPMVKLQHYINKHQLRLVDFFNRFDKDGSMSVTREEFAQGIEETGIKLTEDEINLLLDELDKDGDGEINYSEMVLGHQDFTEKEKKMATQIMNMGRKDSLW